MVHVAVDHRIADDDGAVTIGIAEPRSGIDREHILVLRQHDCTGVIRLVDLLKAHAAAVGIFGSDVALIKLAWTAFFIKAPRVIAEAQEGNIAFGQFLPECLVAGGHGIGAGAIFILRAGGIRDDQGRVRLFDAIHDQLAPLGTLWGHGDIVTQFNRAALAQQWYQLKAHFLA